MTSDALELLERDQGRPARRPTRRSALWLAVALWACNTAHGEADDSPLDRSIAEPLAGPIAERTVDAAAEAPPAAVTPSTAAAPAAPTVAITTPTPERPAAEDPAPVVELDERQRASIEEWFQLVEGPRPDESYGALVARVARHKLGTRYASLRERGGDEVLRVDVERLDCVSLIESADAIARCTWRHEPTVGCFVEELRHSRYREGHIDGYASRLHYFEDWMADNERRSRVRSLGTDLGADALTRSFHFMTRHPKRYPALREPQAWAALREIEQRLSETPWPVVPRGRIAEVQHLLRDGDILGFVEDTPGLGVGHVGLVSMGEDGRPRVLHATDLTGRVTLSRCDVARCTRLRRRRRGVLVMRPLPPPVEARAAVLLAEADLSEGVPEEVSAVLPAAPETATEVAAEPAEG